MTQDSQAANAIDWRLTTWEGSRREQLRRWAALPLERVILAIEEMQDLADQFGASGTLADSPAYTAAPSDLTTFDAGDLMDMLIAEEDRAPRALIDECVRRGEAMVECVAALLEEDSYWKDEGAPGEWWLLLHAVMILGLIPGERAGLLLVAFMRRMAPEEDDNLQDWLDGYWPALFRNKPGSVAGSLRELAQDRGVDWYMRANAVEAALMIAQNCGHDALEAALDWAAGIAADGTEDRTLRFLAGAHLLDFPRPRFRSLLEGLAKQQRGVERLFTRKHVASVYESPEDSPAWSERDNPWEFYLPENIAERQRQWAREEVAAEVAADEKWGEEQYDDEDADWDGPGETYVREAPKIGRNDPCPCGSGKKYKKCCLAKDQA